MASITDRIVKSAALPAKGQEFIWDSGKGCVSGFGVRLTPGTRTFVFQYRNAEGISRRHKIGRYGPLEWSVERARKRAGDLRRAVDLGGDPAKEKQATRTAPTIGDLCDRYVEDHLPRKRESSQRNDKSIIATIVKPGLANRKVAAVTHADIDKLHRDLKATPYQANRALALLSKMFSLAIKWGWRADNPCKGVERYTESKRTRYLKPDELKRLTEALAAYPEQRAAKVDRKAKNANAIIAREIEWGRRAADAIRLLLLTGARRGEVLGATWPQFDLEGGEWVKSGSTTKQKTEHRVPLGAAAVALLKDIRARAPKGEDGEPASAFVFPGRTPAAPLAELKDEWQAIRTAAGISDLRAHDLRHSFASMLASGGASLPMIGALLGHSNPSTTARYSHLFSDPLRKLADEVGHVVSGTKAADVVKHPKAEAS